MELIEKQYDREKAVAYARRWAFGRNPDYYDFTRIGGDCTNSASQVLYAGAGVMNFTPTFGWYYRSLNDRTPSWTGVEFFYNFLVNNEGEGPYAEEVPLDKLERGDFVQLGRATGDWYHTPVVVGFKNGEILVAAHSYDAYNRPLSSYDAAKVRGIHILGVRELVPAETTYGAERRGGRTPFGVRPPRQKLYSIPFSLRIRLTSLS